MVSVKTLLVVEGSWHCLGALVGVRTLQFVKKVTHGYGHGPPRSSWDMEITVACKQTCGKLEQEVIKF